MTGTMLVVLGLWLVSLFLGLPLFAGLGLASFGFVWLSGIPLGIVAQKMAQAANSFPCSRPRCSS